MVRDGRARKACNLGKISYAGAARVLQQRHKDVLAVFIAQGHQHVATGFELASKLAHGLHSQRAVA